MRAEVLCRPLWAAGTFLFVAAVALAVLFVGGRWDRVEEPSWLAEMQEELTTAETARPRQSSDYSIVWRRMGGPPKPRPQPPVQSVQVSETGGYEVVATFCEDEAEFCYAVMRDRAKDQYLLAVGDTVGALTVRSITPEGVLVGHGNGQSFLRIVSRAEQGAAVASVSPGLGLRGRGAPLFVPTAERAAEDLSDEEEAYDAFTVSQEELNHYVANLPTLLGQVELEPQVGEDGEVVGLRIVTLPPNSVAAQRGLKEGDVVMEVYETPLTSPRLLFRIAYEVLQDDPPFVDVIVERDGEEEELIYELR